MDWTDTAVAQLRHLLALGFTSRQIADQLGCSRNAVIGKVNRLGLAKPTPSSIARLANKAAGPIPEPAEPTEPTERDGQSPARPAIASTKDAVAALERGQCRYPHGDPSEPGFHFCTRPTTRVFCPKHHALCYTRESTGIAAWRKRQVERKADMRRSAA